MKIIRLSLLLVMGLLGLLLGGCATAPRHDDRFYAPTLPPAALHPPRADGSIYHSGQDMQLFQDPKAHRIGDILTVSLLENTNASKKTATSTKKNDQAALAAPTLAGGPVTYGGRAIFKNNLKADRSFDGEGASSESNQLTGSITVTVAKRLANGNLVVRGQKWLTLNQGSEFVRISGIVRPVDIGPDNVVPSTKVANANIAYSGNGVLHEANAQGWLGRFFNSPWFPF